MRKPTLTDESFIRSVFQPSKNPTPKGLRHRTVKHLPGRSARRVRAFNRLSAKNQLILDKTGRRDAYLRGETTVTQARASLRVEGIRHGWARPPRVRVDMVGKVVAHITAVQTAATGQAPDPANLRARVERMTPAQRAEAVTMSWGRLRQKAADRREMRPPVRQRGGFSSDDDTGDDYYVDEEINPFWYND